MTVLRASGATSRFFHEAMGIVGMLPRPFHDVPPVRKGIPGFPDRGVGDRHHEVRLHAGLPGMTSDLLTNMAVKFEEIPAFDQFLFRLTDLHCAGISGRDPPAR